MPEQLSQQGYDGLVFQAVPGGSVLNASVSLGRMGINVNLISEFGTDKAADYINDFLESNAVNTNFCIRHTHRKTSVALAFLDENKQATYSFYHDTPDKILLDNIPVFNSSDILLFGSFYAVKPNRRELIFKVLQKVVESQVLIYYDLNIRKSQSDQMELLLPSFLKNIAITTIVKGSDEDFFRLFGLSDPVAIYEKVSRFCKMLIITCGSKPMHVFTPSFEKTYKIAEIIPVSTIGAGDNFNAGFLYGIATSGIEAKDVAAISVTEMDRLVGCGLAFATETCMKMENYVTGNFEPDFWKKYI